MQKRGISFFFIALNANVCVTQKARFLQLKAEKKDFCSKF